METAIMGPIYRGYIEIMEKKMETTVYFSSWRLVLTRTWQTVLAGRPSSAPARKANLRTFQR